MPYIDREAARAATRRSYHKHKARLLPLRNARERLARKLDPTRQRKYNFSKKYKISLSQYEQALQYQGGVCAICARAPRAKRLNVDHDHKTGRVRGLLCWWCNCHVVTQNVNARHLRQAADYLESTFDVRHFPR